MNYLLKILQSILWCITIIGSATVTFILLFLCFSFLYHCKSVDYEEDKHIIMAAPAPEVSRKLNLCIILTSKKDLQSAAKHWELLKQVLPEKICYENNFEFDNYDYILSIGFPIKSIHYILWDDCSIYDKEKRIPIYPITAIENIIQSKVFVYKIKKNTYRMFCFI